MKDMNTQQSEPNELGFVTLGNPGDFNHQNVTEADFFYGRNASTDDVINFDDLYHEDNDYYERTATAYDIGEYTYSFFTSDAK
jgi:hypothetical protein